MEWVRAVGVGLVETPLGEWPRHVVSVLPAGVTSHAGFLWAWSHPWAVVAAVCVAYLVGRVAGAEKGAVDIEVEMTDVERGTRKLDKWGGPESEQAKALRASNRIPCYDPATLEFFGSMPVESPEEVRAKIQRAREAQEKWAALGGSTKGRFALRRRFLRTLLKYIVENQETICMVAGRDSGKVLVDASFGEVLVTCEKIAWLLKEGETHLKDEPRSKSSMMVYKRPRVEYHPVGVMGAIVPWNYPFHNVMNPLVANLFAGNALVVKVSEHASWSSAFYLRMVREALKAVGGPEDLVQIVTGYAETGSALVSGGVDKLVFVGSPWVGKAVMKTAAETLTPVVLELGGKDPIVVCEDADLEQAVATSLRGSFQSCGQNCAGAERIFVRKEVYASFVMRATDVVRTMRQGACSQPDCDLGAMCMPQEAARIQGLVDDAEAKGARLLAGGAIPDQRKGQFYPPTILADIKPHMRIAREEVFGPVMCISCVENDAEAVMLCNDCPFGLGSSVFSRSKRRANHIARQLKCGMSSINDFATTYMCQSLPFGGVKDSGFDRFAGIEGLRGCCVPKAVVDDIWPFRTDIPPPLQYPVAPTAFDFTKGLVRMFYADSLVSRARGLGELLGAMLASKGKGKAKQA